MTNYVLFFADEMRPESLGPYGHPLVSTPNFDRIAAEGTVFENCYTAHPVCLASRAALMTGLYPHVHGHRTLRYEVENHKPNFFRDLRNSGVRTCLAAKNHCLSPTATQESFDRFVPFLRPGENLFDHINGKTGEHNNLMLLPPMSEEKAAGMRDAYFVDEGVKFIAEAAADEAPFFLYQSLDYPHPAYTAPEEYYSMYDPDDLPPMRDLSWLEGKPRLYELIRKYRELDLEDEAIFRKVNAIYLGMISYTDMLLGRVIDALEQAGVYDDTVIAISADHGDFGGDVGLVEKWPNAMDDMLTKVPMIIKWPDGAPGHRVTEPMQTIDFFPTVFDHENLDITHDQFGISVLDQIKGAPGDPTRSVYCEGGYDLREPHAFEGGPVISPNNAPGSMYYPKGRQQQEEPSSVCRTVMQRDNRYKLTVRTSGENELYDMIDDPYEYTNLYGDPRFAQLQTELTQRMLTWMISTSDVIPRTQTDETPFTRPQNEDTPKAGANA